MHRRPACSNSQRRCRAAPSCTALPCSAIVLLEAPISLPGAPHCKPLPLHAVDLAAMTTMHSSNRAVLSPQHIECERCKASVTLAHRDNRYVVCPILQILPNTDAEPNRGVPCLATTRLTIHAAPRAIRPPHSVADKVLLRCQSRHFKPPTQHH